MATPSYPARPRGSVMCTSPSAGRTMSQRTAPSASRTLTYPSPEGEPPAATCASRVAARLPSITRMRSALISSGLLHPRRDRQPSALEKRAQHVRPVGSHAVYFKGKHALHVGWLIDGPGNDAQPERVRLGDALRIEIRKIRTPESSARGLDEAHYGAPEARGIEPAKPRRRPRGAEADGVPLALLLRQRDGDDLRHQPLYGPQHPPIECHDVDQRRHTFRLEVALEGDGKRLRTRRELGRPVREGLHLDGHAHAPAPARTHELEDVREARHALAIDRLLGRKARGIGAAGIEAPHVVALQLRAGETDDRRPGFAQEASGRIPREIGIELGVVRDDRDAIAAQRAVELDRVHADRERAGKSCEGVLRPQTAGAAVALHIRHKRRSCDRGSHDKPLGAMLYSD